MLLPLLLNNLLSGGVIGTPKPLVLVATSATVRARSPYTQVLVATGGVPPYAFSVIGGGLPPGLALSSAGVISGTPTVGGAFPFTVQVMDTQPATATAVFGIRVTTRSRYPVTTTRSRRPNAQPFEE